MQPFEKVCLKPKIIFGSIVIALALILGGLSLYFLYLPPKALAFVKANDLVDLKGKISVEFNKPVDRNKINYTITPSASGTLSFDEEILKAHLYRRVAFIPDDILAPNQEYKLTLKNISSIYGPDSERNYEIAFKTKNVPSIQSFSLADESKNVSPNGTIEAILDQNNGGIVDYDFSLDPGAEIDVKYDDQHYKYLISPQNPLLQNQSYKLTASRTILGKTDAQPPIVLNFKTKGAPQIKSSSPSGGNVLVSTSKLQLTFTEEMDQASVLSNISVTPAVKGTWKWQDDTTLVFSAEEKLAYGTNYNITIKKGVKDSLGGYIQDDIVCSFSTVGRVTVTSFSPKNNASGISASSAIKIQFNQNVDHSSAESLFSIEPKVNGAFSWQGNTLIFSPSALSKDSSYKIHVSGGVKSIDGLDSNQTFSSNFTTETSTTILPVTIDLQDRSLSCEAAALKMALNYKGAGVSENDIMAIVGYDPTIHDGNIWGDPNSAFVGDINGHQNTTGYGVYWDPIARAADTWRPAKSFSGWSASDLAKAIAAGNPVVIWGVYGNGYADSWVTPSGKKISAWKGEHARTAIGFKGSVNNPTEFIINDPYAGKITWSTSKLMSDWSRFGYSGVVVY